MRFIIFIISIFLFTTCKNNTNFNCEVENAQFELSKEISYLQSVSNEVYLGDQLHCISFQNDTLSLFDIAERDQILFYYFSEMNCMMCIDQEIKYLKRIKSIHKDVRIILLANYDSLRDLYVFQKVNAIPFEIYQLKEEEMNLPIGKLNLSFYFMLDENAKTRNVFVPDKSEWKQQYLDWIIEKIIVQKDS